MAFSLIRRLIPVHYGREVKIAHLVLRRAETMRR